MPFDNTGAQLLNDFINGGADPAWMQRTRQALPGQQRLPVPPANRPQLNPSAPPSPPAVQPTAAPPVAPPPPMPTAPPTPTGSPIPGMTEQQRQELMRTVGGIGQGGAAGTMGGLGITGGMLPATQFTPPTAAPRFSTPGQTIQPMADNQAIQAYNRGQGGYLPPNMAFQASPGQAPPMPGLEAITDDAGNSYFVAAGSAGTPTARQVGTPGIQGLPSFEEFRRQMMNTNIGANSPALLQAYLGLQTTARQNQVPITAAQNETTRTQAEYGPGGLAGGRLQLDRDRLANETWSRTPDGRRARIEEQALAAYLGQQVAPGQQRRPMSSFVADLQNAERSGLLGGANPPSSPASPSATPSTPATPTSRYNPTSPAGSPVYEPHREMLDGVRSGLREGERSVGAFLARLNRDTPGFVQQNFPAVEAYLRDTFGSADFDVAARGASETPIGPIANQGGSVIQSLFNWATGRNRWTDDLEGRSMLQNYLSQNRTR